jgi:3-methylcrotonyl-CoA carboxylase alpha subunit
MEKAGVAVVPGYHGDRQDPAFLKQKAYEIGYPVLIKAIAGGGGKGMRKVDKHAEFEAALEAAQREAASSFGEPRVLLEKYVISPRHIEIQVMADTHGNALHLNERDCSLQRRHQKVIEEAPAPGMTPELRAAMGAAAVKAAKAVGYTGAGTVEFIADGAGKLRPDGFWFMEMNTRLQVEHPVTEAITGLDLVEWQFRTAAGEKLPMAQEQVQINGHAVEARLYAEDPERGFLPSTGRLIALKLPEGDGIRVDTGVETGSDITAYYDPMIAKLIAHGATREQALSRLAGALESTVVAGPRSNVAFLSALCRAKEFRAGAVDTGFIERSAAALGLVPQGLDHAAAATGAAKLIERDRERIVRNLDRAPDVPASPWDAADGFQLSGRRTISVAVAADGEPVRAEATSGSGGVSVTVDGMAAALDAVMFDGPDGVYVLRHGRQTVVRPEPSSLDHPGGLAGGGLIKAPMHGKVLALLVAEGDSVVKGQRLAIIEAMKMEHALTAPHDGTVTGVSVVAGGQIAEGAKIMMIETASETN